jgi:hypothetical protein
VTVATLSPGAASALDIFYGTHGFSSPGVINAPNIGMYLATPPVVLGKQIFSVALPTDINLSNVALRVDLVSNGSTSGSCQVNVYAVWVEVEE